VQRAPSATTYQVSAEPSAIAALSFSGTWRRYQSLALDAFESGRTDGRRRTHIVAPPGSGKTLLGVEIVRRLASPALVLAPNSAVQSQWIGAAGRFNAPAGVAAADTSAPIACLTYQALCQFDDPSRELATVARRRWAEDRATALGSTPEEVDRDAETWTGEAAARRRKELARVTAALKRSIARADDGTSQVADLLSPGVVARLGALRSNGVATVVLDECHHLASMWGYAVRTAIAELGDAHVVGITATPPDELTTEEAELYEALLGPVDFQVPTPAVVREGFLAPYQELAWLVPPLQAELDWLEEHDVRFAELVDTLHDATGSPVMSFPEWVITRIRHRGREQDDGDAVVAWSSFQKAHPALARAGARFLLSGGLDLPPDVPRGEGYRERPDLEDWLALLQDYALHCLAADPSSEAAAAYQRIASALRGLGFTLTRQGIRRGASETDHLLTRSAAKTVALADVIACELDARGNQLRALVLCDSEQAVTVNDASLASVLDPTSATAPSAVTALAADLRTGVLRPLLVSGRGLRCHPGDADVLLAALSRCAGDAVTNWRTNAENGELVGLVASGPAWEPRLWVQLATAVFAEGTTKALVGTRALLGEGWDAPCVNCLVDLSEATTGVAVTQMRGRSLRLDPADPEKIASNWDIVCVADNLARGNADYERFVRKHVHLFAPSEDGAIEAGPSHVHPSLGPFAPPPAETYGQVNRDMARRAAQHREAREKWRLGEPYSSSVNDTLVVLPRAGTHAGVGLVPPPLAAADRPAALPLSQALPLGVAAAGVVAAAVGGLAGVDVVPIAAAGVVPAALGWSTWRLSRARDALAGPLPLDRAARCVADAYLQLGELSPQAARSLAVEPRASGYLRCVLRAATPDESARFVAALDELIAPQGAPRYLVSRLVASRGTGGLTLLGRVVRHRKPFDLRWVGVPRDFGRAKARAEVFAAAWGRLMGPSELRYVQGSDEGHELAASAEAERLDYETAARKVWS
jgi:superfamily II DNA or RNA helicase